jgi:hypothetical protein
VIIKIGNVNIAGPGYIVEELGMRQNLNISSSGSSKLACPEDGSAEDNRAEDYQFNVYAQQQCDIVRAFQLEDRVQKEIDKAIDNQGHLTYYYNLEGYIRRREIISGTLGERLPELKFKSKRTVAFELDIETHHSKLLEPVRARNFGPHGLMYAVDWENDSIQAHLVMTNTTVAAEQITAEYLTDFTVLDEFDGANYTSIEVPDKTVVGNAYKAGDLVWNLLGNGTRQIEGIVIAEYNVFLGYIPASTWTGGSFETGQFDPGGDTITFPVNLYGLLKQWP